MVSPESSGAALRMLSEMAASAPLIVRSGQCATCGRTWLFIQRLALDSKEVVTIPDACPALCHACEMHTVMLGADHAGR